MRRRSCASASRRYRDSWFLAIDKLPSTADFEVEVNRLRAITDIVDCADDLFGYLDDIDEQLVSLPEAVTDMRKQLTDINATIQDAMEQIDSFDETLVRSDALVSNIPIVFTFLVGLSRFAGRLQQDSQRAPEL